MSEVAKNIVLIGAGQLGSRHLQGLAQVSVPSRIFVVDPSAASLDTARLRYQEMAANPQVVDIRFLPGLDGAPGRIDLAIVATGADVRADITAALLEKREVSHLILEKVLFQKESDYDRIAELLVEHRVGAAVNCPRRIYPLYRQALASFSGEEPIYFTVEGSQWGLGCNAVHYLDLFVYLTGGASYSIEAADLGERVLASKREGLVEFAGTISGRNARGATFSITSSPEPGVAARICIESRTRRLEVFESGNKAVLTDKVLGEVREEPYSAPFQSQLTGAVATELLTTGVCGLTPYQESAALHLPLLRIFLEHLNRISGTRHHYCPIT